MNLFDFPKRKLKKEITQIIEEGENFRIERILSDGQTSDWYDQNEAEWVSLLNGEAELEFEDGIRTIKKGESLLILPHEKHRVAKTSKCIWLCAFFKYELNYFVYLLLCNDKSIYCGYTNNLEARVKTHNSGKGAKYTKARLPVELVYSESFQTKSQALKRECEIKKLSRNEKLKLIENCK